MILRDCKKTYLYEVPKLVFFIVHTLWIEKEDREDCAAATSSIPKENSKVVRYSTTYTLLIDFSGGMLPYYVVLT